MPKKRLTAKQIAQQKLWQAKGAASRRALGHGAPAKGAAPFTTGPNGQKLAPSLDAVGAVWNKPNKPVTLRRKNFSSPIKPQDLKGKAVKS